MLISIDEEENPSEFLLLFNNLGVYVDAYGRRSRAQELMFPCRVTDGGVSFHRPYLCLYSENQIDVFNVNSSEWSQTINLKKARPLHDSGLLSICIVADMPYLVLLSNVTQCKFEWLAACSLNDNLAAEEQLYVPPTLQTVIQGKGVQKRRRKFSVSSIDNSGGGSEHIDRLLSGKVQSRGLHKSK